MKILFANGDLRSEGFLLKIGPQLIAETFGERLEMRKILLKLPRIKVNISTDLRGKSGFSFEEIQFLIF